MFCEAEVPRRQCDGREASAVCGEPLQCPAARGALSTPAVLCSPHTAQMKLHGRRTKQQ